MDRFPPYSWEKEQKKKPEEDVFDAYDKWQSQILDTEEQHDKNDMGSGEER